MKKYSLVALFSLVLASFPSLSNAERVITLGGPVTEIAFALGAGPRIVAVDQSSLYPEAARDLPQVGYVGAIGAEGVLSMNPTLIIATTRLGPPSAVSQLENSEIPLVLVPNPNDLASLRNAIDQIASALALEDAADRLWSGIAGDIRSLQSLSESAEPPRVAFIMGNNGIPLAAGADTQAAGMIGIAGGQNVFTGYNGYKPVSEEAILTAAPDIILIASHQPAEGADPLERLRDLGLTTVARTRSGRVFLIDLSTFLSFGPRTGDAARELARLFYP